MSTRLSRNFFQGSVPIVLVAGGAGFIGSHICESLLKKGLKVVCVDNWQTGLKENVSGLSQKKNFLLLARDANSRLPKIVSRVDYVIDLVGAEVDFDGGDVTLESLRSNSLGVKNLLDFSRKHNARFLFISSLDFNKEGLLSREFSGRDVRRFAEALAMEYSRNGWVDVRIVQLGDVYGPRMLLSSKNILGVLIKGVVDGGDFSYKKMLQKQRKLYPVFIKDVVSCVQRSLFSSGLDGFVVRLVGSPVRVEEVVEVLKDVEGKEMEIGFGQSFLPISNSFLFSSSGDSVVYMRPKTSLRSGLRQTVQWLVAHRNFLFRSSSKGPPKKKRVLRGSLVESVSFWGDLLSSKEQLSITERQNQHEDSTLPMFNIWLLFAGSFVALLFWFLVLPFLQFGAGVVSLYLVQRTFSNKQALTSSSVGGLGFWSGQAMFFFENSKGGFLRWQKVPFLKSVSTRALGEVRVLQRLSSVGKTSSRLLKKTEELAVGVLGSGAFSLGETWGDVVLDLDSLSGQLAFLETEVMNSNNYVIADLPFLQLFTSQSFGFGDVRRSIDSLVDVLKGMPSVLGKDERKVYFVALQDNRALWPSGGIIRAFALVEFYGGRLDDVEIHGVDFADSRLNGHVEPPLAIKEYYGRDSWYLRNSGWSPNFPTAARRAAWFVGKELDVSLDGVIALDLEFVRDFLENTGPVVLSSGEIVSGENFYGRIDSFDNEDFLMVLDEVVLSRLSDLTGGYVLSFLKTFLNSLETGHAALWIDDPRVNNAAFRAGWDGSLGRTACESSGGDFSSETCLSDYIQVVESDFGERGLGFNLTPVYVLDASVEPSRVVHKLTVSYEPRGLLASGDVSSGLVQGASVGGRKLPTTLKRYLRLFVPKEANLVEVLLVDSETGVQDEVEVVEPRREGGRNVFGVFLERPVDRIGKVVFVWDLPVDGLYEDGTLDFLWQKQLGSLGSDVWLNVKLPSGGYEVLSSFPPTLTSSGSVSYNTTLSKDLSTQISWKLKR